jgi:hypothetical protein
VPRNARRKPEAGDLYQVVQQELETFLAGAHARERRDAPHQPRGDPDRDRDRGDDGEPAGEQTDERCAGDQRAPAGEVEKESFILPAGFARHRIRSG